ncbi:phage holin family protein [Neoroseomonas lacus]|uniref:Membrane protein n=1 Tax=Neoroseomonas lacus TaxID=287609 RepID=A0A917L257_9PROT|nr:phage holin family protein [Neoroseomonas lacus]GGJ38602.1 membrane protein [Neoroseomonas lacus]
MIGFFIRTAVTAVALWVAVAIVPGISAQDTGTLVLAAIVLGVINATVRPLAVLLSIPITIITFGLFLLVVNAGMLALVAWLVPAFNVAGFGSALLGSIVVSIVSAVIGGAMAES